MEQLPLDFSPIIYGDIYHAQVSGSFLHLGEEKRWSVLAVRINEQNDKQWREIIEEKFKHRHQAFKRLEQIKQQYKLGEYYEN